jgi:hypothetical protein
MRHNNDTGFELGAPVQAEAAKLMAKGVRPGCAVRRAAQRHGIDPKHARVLLAEGRRPRLGGPA